MKFIYYAITYFVNRIKNLFAPNSKKKVLLLLCCVSSIAGAEWQSTDSATLNTIKGEVQSINTSTLESENKLQEIQTHLNSIRNWKSIFDSIDNSSESIMGHTTYFYNVLSSLASAYPTISQSSWFGQVLQEQKNFNTKLQTLIDNPIDLSSVEGSLNSIDNKLGVLSTIDDTLTGMFINSTYINDKLDTLTTIDDSLSNLLPMSTDTSSINDNTSSINDKLDTLNSIDDNLITIADDINQLYAAFFDPTAYDTYYQYRDLNYDPLNPDAVMNAIQSTTGGTLIPGTYRSFVGAFLNQQLAKSRQDVQNTKLLNVANLNLQDIRKNGIHNITNLISSQTDTLDQSISNNVNRLITALKGTGSDYDTDSSLTDIQAQLLTQIIQNENLREHLYTAQMNFSGEFKKDLLRLLRYQTTLDVSQNYAQLSILTNLQCLVVNTIGEQERLQDEFEQGTEAIDKEGKQGLAMFEDNTSLSEHFAINNSIAEDYIKSKDVDFKVLKNLSADKFYFTGFDIPAIRLDPNGDTPLDFEIKVDDSIHNYDIFLDVLKYIRFGFTLFNWSLGLYISYLIIGYSFKILLWCFSLMHGSSVSYSFVSKGYM